MDWATADEDMLSFTRRVIELRLKHPIFRRRRFFEGRRISQWDEVPDISWLQPNGDPMTPHDWQVGYARTLTVVLNGSALNEKDRFGRDQQDRSFALFFNAADQDIGLHGPGAHLRGGVDRGARHRGVARAAGPADHPPGRHRATGRRPLPGRHAGGRAAHGDPSGASGAPAAHSAHPSATAGLIGADQEAGPPAAPSAPAGAASVPVGAGSAASCGVGSSSSNGTSWSLIPAARAADP